MDRDEQIRAAKNGDLEARKALLEWVYPELWQFFKNRRFDVVEVGDLVHDTVKDIMRKLSTHAPDSADLFVGWALSFAGTTARAHKTKLGRSGYRRAKLAAQAPVLALRTSLHSRMHEDQRERALFGYISQLPAIYGDVIRHRLDGRKFESIARRENIPAGTARRRYSVGVKMLRELIMAAGLAPSS